MNTCKDVWARITLWLDGELQGDEISQLESHLNQCATCRERLASERRFLETVRTAKPLHTAPDKLKNEVERILRSPAESPAPAPGFFRPLRHSLRPIQGFVILLAIISLALVFWIWPQRGKYGTKLSGPSSFALMAADTHRRYIQGQLPLEIVSRMPDKISGWFSGKVPFALKLPDYQEESGQRKLYQLEGARLVGYREDYAAYIAYQMNDRPISLVVTSDSVARPAGGQQIMARGLTFHFDSIYGFKVITWSDRGLTYALVSDLEEKGQQSCIVCHQGSEDKDLLELNRAVTELR
jgi:anti-sigma factor RsiW